jgi:hypothetical protein
MASEFKTEGEEALSKARQQLSDLFRQQEALSLAISKQQRRVAALAALVDESEETDQLLDLNLGGLTDAIRGVLRDGGLGLSPKQVRTRLIQQYFPVNEYKNFMASLHSVLARLIKAREVKTVVITTTESGQQHDEICYRWIPKYGATNSLANTILRTYSKYDPQRSKWKSSKDKSVRRK